MNAKQRRKARRLKELGKPLFGAMVTEPWLTDLTLEEILKAAAKAQERGAAFDPETIKFLQQQEAVIRLVTRD